MADEKTDIPPDNGHRAHVDKDGAVKGSGVGAGGGQDGEDFDDDPMTGSATPSGKGGTLD